MPRSAQGTPPPAELWSEVAAAFRRHRPQGSHRWNFAGAFADLERRFGQVRPVAEDPGPQGGPAINASEEPPAAGTDEPPAAGSLEPRPVHSVFRRQVLERLAPWVDARARSVATEVVTEALAEPVRRLDGDVRRLDGGVLGLESGMASAVEAFRFLAARLETLESAADRRRSPVDAIEWLVPPADDALTGPLCEWLAANHGHGVVVHAECGRGALVEALGAVGVTTVGIEPRGLVAYEASVRGAEVRVGPADAAIAEMDPGSAGGMVLSGVVDRVSVDELVRLLALATSRIQPGAPLVVVGTDPAAARDVWGPVAWDLLPGRPLHPETWEELLARGGYEDVGRLEDARGAGSAVPQFVVKGRRPA
jgi:hypothetical protein